MESNSFGEKAKTKQNKNNKKQQNMQNYNHTKTQIQNSIKHWGKSETNKNNFLLNRKGN